MDGCTQIWPAETLKSYLLQMLTSHLKPSPVPFPLSYSRTPSRWGQTASYSLTHQLFFPADNSAEPHTHFSLPCLTFGLALSSHTGSCSEGAVRNQQQWGAGQVTRERRRHSQPGKTYSTSLQPQTLPLP